MATISDVNPDVVFTALEILDRKKQKCIKENDFETAGEEVNNISCR
jgi:hypothetical protein